MSVDLDDGASAWRGRRLDDECARLRHKHTRLVAVVGQLGDQSRSANKPIGWDDKLRLVCWFGQKRESESDKWTEKSISMIHRSVGRREGARRLPALNQMNSPEQNENQQHE